MFELLVQGRVALLTLCRPPVNAISEQWGEGFLTLLERLEARDDWNVLHLRSNQKVFAAGADLAQIESWISAPRPDATLSAYIRKLQAVLRRLESTPRVTLAEIGGAALGGGLELALACGSIFAGRDAHFGQPEIRLGVIAPAASVLLPYRVSQPVAEDLLLSGRSITADEALQCGLVQALAEDPEAAALDWFTQHLQPRSGASLGFALSAVRGQMRKDVRRRLAEVEQIYLERLMRTHDANEGLTAFLDKRQPDWTHQ